MRTILPRPGRGRSAPAVLLLASTAAAALTACGDRQAGGPAVPAAAAPAVTASATITPSGASPYADDGAPHGGDNLAYRRESEVAAADEADARREAGRLEPAFKELWERQTWTPDAVRAALRKLGHPVSDRGANGGAPEGTLVVDAFEPRYDTDHYVTAPGVRIAVLLHGRTCVSGYVAPARYELSVHGVYPETGCFQPPYGH
ncbi:hypothetical protein [Kitasatospora phosalacinea]|nr:hypothetical protein [Kitasatospora phosalacinea]